MCFVYFLLLTTNSHHFFFFSWKINDILFLLFSFFFFFCFHHENGVVHSQSLHISSFFCCCCCCVFLLFRCLALWCEIIKIISGKYHYVRWMCFYFFCVWFCVLFTKTFIVTETTPLFWHRLNVVSFFTAQPPLFLLLMLTVHCVFLVNGELSTSRFASFFPFLFYFAHWHRLL